DRHRELLDPFVLHDHASLPLHLRDRRMGHRDTGRDHRYGRGSGRTDAEPVGRQVRLCAGQRSFARIHTFRANGARRLRSDTDCDPVAPGCGGRRLQRLHVHRDLLGTLDSAYFVLVTLTGKRLAFIGGGTMAEAMVRGLLNRHLVPPSHVLVTGPRREPRAELATAYGVKPLASDAEAAHDAHVGVLSVKPQVLGPRM